MMRAGAGGRALLAVLCIASLAGFAHADAVLAGPPPGDGNIEAFFNGVIPSQLAKYHIPGAAIVVVRGDGVVFARGYGHADPLAGEPMDPARTLVRVGSISKVVTWIGVMQQVDRGNLDLDTDINVYLSGVRVADTYPGWPVTLRHLMTHSAGFEDRLAGIFTPEGSTPLPPCAALARGMPARVRPPGEVPSYSNHGAALAACAIENATGTRFEEYAEYEILRPVGMGNSTFLQPPPAGLRERLAGGFVFSGGKYERQDFEHVTFPASGGLSATPLDMGLLVACLLNGGNVSGRQAIDGRVVRSLFEICYSPDPRVEGWRGGFMEMREDGRYVLWHGGDTLHSSSLLALYPAERTGLFVTYNSGNGAVPAREILSAFTRQVTPCPEPPLAVACGTPGKGRDPPLTEVPAEEGRYVSTRRPVTNYERVLLLSPAAEYSIDVRKVPDGGIEVGGTRLSPVSPGSFADPGGRVRAVFVSPPSGGRKYLLLANSPGAMYEKVEWYGDPSFVVPLLVASLTVLLAYLVTCAASIVLPARHVTKRRISLYHLHFSILSGLCVAFVLALFSLLRGDRIFYFPGATLSIVLSLPLLTLAMTGISVPLAARAWTRRDHARGDRIGFLAVTAAATVFSWWTVTWNLVRFPI
ncbi:MAG: serine hydrolase domain-containing protein [Methanolinea sp.]|nr:serine hydrolase domain-containing protein [Methanolinea sp.]